VGFFRMALVPIPNGIDALIVSGCGSRHNEGLGAKLGSRDALSGPISSGGQRKARLRTNLLSLQTTRTRHVGKTIRTSNNYDPDLWTDEFAFLVKPGPSGHSKAACFMNYRTNGSDAYPRWQTWMREKQAAALGEFWGKYDLSV